MLPSMPILFTRESQDGFGISIQPTTSFFSQNLSPKRVIPEIVPEPPQVAPKQTEPKNKPEPVKKNKDPPKDDENALENAFIRSYYQRVQSRFSSNTSVPTNKFVQFQNLLKNFNPNVETPVDLYKKVEKLFGTEHKDIVEDFLLFLTPGQTVEVGKFMERFQLVQMTNFINMLHTTFARKPTVLRKVLRALTNALNNGNSTDLKARVLPHLRSNPRLTQLFKSLFPDERPADSFYESGVDTANESFLTGDKGYDVWEFDDDSENKKKLGHKDELDTMYMNGRVFLQHGRLLRSARVTYPYSKEPYRVHARRLAPAHSHPTPPESDEETPQKQPKNTPKRTRKQTKSPTKKDVNDNTKNNVINSPKPKKAQKAKNGKKEPECGGQKRERKDSKNSTAVKKDNDAPKAKQAKVEATATTEVKNEIKETDKKKDTKLEIKTEAASGKMEAKIIPPNNTVVKIVAPIHTKLETLPKVKAKVENSNVQAKIEASVSVETKKIEKSNNWTRDEDKTMLQVLKGEAGSEKVFGRIRELLPHRSATEIKERFCHVMTLLQQMAVSEVT